MKTLRIAIIGIAAFALAGRAAAQPWYVALSGDGADGLSWATAYTSVQTAIDAASDGDTIYIKGETFTLPVNHSLGRLYWSAKNLTIEGGYAGTIGETPGGLAGETVLLNTGTSDATENQRVLYALNVTNGVLRRVTLRGGRVTSPTNRGGGMVVLNCPGLLLDTCKIIDNQASRPWDNIAQGGGIYTAGSTLTLTNSIVEQNWATTGNQQPRGAGIYLASGTLNLFGTTLRFNRGRTWYGNSGYGGALYVVAGATANLHNCLVYGNHSLASWDSRNTSSLTRYGDAIYSLGTLTVEHSTIVEHTREGINRGGGTVTVNHSILWGNRTDAAGTMTLNWSNVGTTSGTVTTNNCISTDPQFEYGFYLHPDSPCINVGGVTAEAAGLDSRTTRVDGQPDAGQVDLGYHYASGFDTTWANLHVSTTGNDANNGLTPDTAFRTIGKAFATARDGSTIHIAGGPYTGATETFPLTLQDKVGVNVRGTNATATVIQRTGANRRVMTLARCAGTTRLEGLTLTGGYLDEANVRGVGLYAELCHDLVLADCMITNNITDYEWGTPAWGGGIFAIDGQRLTLTNCVVSGNSVNWSRTWSTQGYGGGLYAENLALVSLYRSAITNNRVSGGGNGASAFGGGICMFEGSLHVEASNILDNGTRPRISDSPGTGYGGGIFSRGPVILRNSLVSGNDANYDRPDLTGLGDGIYVTANAMIENCTVVANHGEGLRRAGGTVTVDNSILWDNGTDAVGTTIVNWSNVGTTSGSVSLNDCISADPLFLDTAYRLGDGSPCVNAGNPVQQAWMAGALDLDGNPRVASGRVDMGAYEVVPPPGSLILLR